MKIIFLRHGATHATNQGLIQGSSNSWDLNSTTTTGLYKVQDSAREIAELLEGKSKEDVYIYSGTQSRCQSSTGVLATYLKARGFVKDENVAFDARLNGRSYGRLEGLPEKKVKTPSYLLFHPAASLSMIAATFGAQNYMRIEPTNEYRERVFEILAEIFMTHNNEKDTVIISATSDMFNFLQKDRELHSICYFGYEQPTFVSGKKPKRIKLEPGQFSTFEVEKPIYAPSTDSWIPVWESLATRDYMEREIINPNQKGE